MERAEELLERIAVGVEKLGEEPEFEIPTSPPICPHCGTLDPNVGVENTAGQGKMSGFFLRLTCLVCSKLYFAVPQGWVNFTSDAELWEFFERAENGTNSTKAN
jgi:hypothetical protein